MKRAFMSITLLVLSLSMVMMLLMGVCGRFSAFSFYYR